MPVTMLLDNLKMSRGAAELAVHRLLDSDVTSTHLCNRGVYIVYYIKVTTDNRVTSAIVKGDISKAHARRPAFSLR